MELTGLCCATGALALGWAWTLLAGRHARRRLERALAELRARADAQAGAVSRVVAELGEQLRAPAADLAAGIDQLVAATCDAERGHALAAIQRSGERVLVAPAQPEAAGGALPPARGQDRRVLLIEDGAGEQRLLANLLRDAGADVSLADDARVGCELALELQRDQQPFDVILLDMELPDRDGWAAAARLRAAGYAGAIVALVGDAAHSERTRAAGCDGHLEKPIDAQRLAAVLARLAGASG
jgi:CheY-like chemotaxis protein